MGVICIYRPSVLGLRALLQPGLRLNPAVPGWCCRPSAASPLKPSRACSGPASLGEPAAEKRGTPGALGAGVAAGDATGAGAASPDPKGQRGSSRGGGRSRVLDLRSVRSRFRHLRSRASSDSGAPAAPLGTAASQPPPSVPEEEAPMVLEYELQPPPPQRQLEPGAASSPSGAAGLPQYTGLNAGGGGHPGNKGGSAQQPPTFVQERSLQQQPVKGADAGATRAVRVCADCVCSSQVPVRAWLPHVHPCLLPLPVVLATSGTYVTSFCLLSRINLGL